jgi:hypothetical protein
MRKPQREQRIRVSEVAITRAVTQFVQTEASKLVDVLWPKRESLAKVLSTRMDAVRTELTNRWALSEDAARQFMNDYTDAGRRMTRKDMPPRVTAFKNLEREAVAIAQITVMVVTLDRYERLCARVWVAPEEELASIDDALATHGVFLQSAKIGRRRQELGATLGDTHAERWRNFDHWFLTEARKVAQKNPDIRNRVHWRETLIQQVVDRLSPRQIELAHGSPHLAADEKAQFMRRLKLRLGPQLSAISSLRTSATQRVQKSNKRGLALK